ncbi:MAG: hypothetical protein ACYC4H_04205 [Desulfocucumaceae bacterium]
MENTKVQKTLVVSIQGWELEVFEGPRKVEVDLLGEMIEFRGIWLTEPERGMVTVLSYPDKLFYLEVTESEIPTQRPGRRNKVTPLRRIDTPPGDENGE